MESFANQKNPLVLVISADKTSCDLIDQWLTMHNYDVLRAYEGESGLLILKTCSITLLIVDSKLPDLSGCDLCLRIKKKKKWRLLPVLLLTEKDVTGSDIKRSLANETCEKPLKKQELIQRAKKLIAFFLEDTLVEYFPPGEKRSEGTKIVERQIKKKTDVENELNNLLREVKQRPSGEKTAAKDTHGAKLIDRKSKLKSDRAIEKKLEDLYRLIK